MRNEPEFAPGEGSGDDVGPGETEALGPFGDPALRRGGITDPDSEEATGNRCTESLGTEALGMEPMGTEPMPFVNPTSLAETEEVYVLLPDEAAADIPVVETEVVEGEYATASDDAAGPETQTEVDLLVPGAGLREVADPDGEPVAPQAPPVGAEEGLSELDEIASDLEDADLAYTGEEYAEGSIPYLPSEDGHPETFAEFDAAAAGGPVGRRSRSRSLLAAAALLTVAGVGVYLGYPHVYPYVKDVWPFTQMAQVSAEPRPTPAVAMAGSPASPVPTETLPGKGPEPGGSGSSVGAGVATGAGSQPAGSGPALDQVELAKVAFHEKFLLAVELGFVGEVGHE